MWNNFCRKLLRREIEAYLAELSPIMRSHYENCFLENSLKINAKRNV